MSPRVPAPVRRLAFATVAILILFVGTGLPSALAAGSGTETGSSNTSSEAGRLGVESVTAQGSKSQDKAKPVNKPGPFTVPVNSAFDFDVSFKNKGSTTWTTLGGYAFENLTTNSPTALGACDPLPPGAICTFHRTVNVGSTTGKFFFIYQMIHNGKGFGKTVKVKFKAVN